MSGYEEYKQINEQILQKLNELEKLDERIETLKKASALLVGQTNIRELGRI